MIYTIKNNPNFNLTADNISDAELIIAEICGGRFTVTKGANTSGCWYKWSINVANRGNVSEVKGRNENEARTNAVNIFNISSVTMFDVKAMSADDVAKEIATTQPIHPQTLTGTSQPEALDMSESFQKAVRPKFVFTIGDSANHHGMYLFEAHSASEAWKIGTDKFNSEFPNDRGSRLGLWQRVLVPVHANKMWISADMAKNIKTPSHFAVDLPVGLGLSNEEWSGPTDMINSNADGVMSSVVQKHITKVASK
jgi:hypothetical protein